MVRIDAPHTFVTRRVLRALARIDRVYTHRGVLRHAAVDRRTVQAARSQWWGHEPRWFPGGTPPRQNNRVTPLIDGDSFFTALRDALTNARHYVYVAGWCLTPRIPLGRESPAELVDTRLLEILSEVAQRLPVRVLLWGGALAFIQPTRRDVAEVREALETEASGDIVCRLDRTSRMTHCHHQKTIVVDGRIAFVGGMDLTTFSGDRWDTHEHPLRAGQNWHDVQLRIEGEAVVDVERNFRERWGEVAGDTKLPHREPMIQPSWETPVQIVRTLPAKTYKFAPQGEFGIFHYYTQAIRRARRFIYIENQYLWSPHVMKALTDVVNAPRDEPFRVVIVLPAHAGDGRWNNDKHVQELRNIDAGRGIISIYSLYTSGPTTGEQPFTYRAIYVHAKVAIFDDEWLTVGSANLNNRGLITDSEINAVVHDPALARQMRLDLWAEHLAMPRGRLESADPIHLIDQLWAERARENAEIIKHGLRPLACALHSYTVGHRPSDRVLEDFQALTFEL